jgi:hypothetical protein
MYILLPATGKGREEARQSVSFTSLLTHLLKQQKPTELSKETDKRNSKNKHIIFPQSSLIFFVGYLSLSSKGNAMSGSTMM